MSNIKKIQEYEQLVMDNLLQTSLFEYNFNEDFHRLENTIDDSDEDNEDLIVDLNSGSLDPINLRNWNLMAALTEKFNEL